MLIWPDDNHGHLRRFLTSERQRPGNGVYYHLTFCDNQWVQWIPLEMIRDEFRAVVEPVRLTMLHNGRPAGQMQRDGPCLGCHALACDRQTPGRYLRQWTAYHSATTLRQAALLYRGLRPRAPGLLPADFDPCLQQLDALVSSG